MHRRPDHHKPHTGWLPGIALCALGVVWSACGGGGGATPNDDPPVMTGDMSDVSDLSTTPQPDMGPSPDERPARPYAEDTAAVMQRDLPSPPPRRTFMMGEGVDLVTGEGTGEVCGALDNMVWTEGLDPVASIQRVYEAIEIAPVLTALSSAPFAVYESPEHYAEPLSHFLARWHEETGLDPWLRPETDQSVALAIHLPTLTRKLSTPPSCPEDDTQAQRCGHAVVDSEEYGGVLVLLFDMRSMSATQRQLMRQKEAYLSPLDFALNSLDSMGLTLHRAAIWAPRAWTPILQRHAPDGTIALDAMRALIRDISAVRDLPPDPSTTTEQLGFLLTQRVTPHASYLYSSCTPWRCLEANKSMLVWASERNLDNYRHHYALLNAFSDRRNVHTRTNADDCYGDNRTKLKTRLAECLSANAETCNRCSATSELGRYCKAWWTPTPVAARLSSPPSKQPVWTFHTLNVEPPSPDDPADTPPDTQDTPPPVVQRWGPSPDDNICVLTRVKGALRHPRDVVRVERRPTGWLVNASSERADTSHPAASMTCTPITNFVGRHTPPIWPEPRGFALRGADPERTLDLTPAHRAVAIHGFGGILAGGGERVRLTLQNRRRVLHARSGQSDLIVAATSFGVLHPLHDLPQWANVSTSSLTYEGRRVLSTTRHGAMNEDGIVVARKRLTDTDRALCFFDELSGNFHSADAAVILDANEDGSWYLEVRAPCKRRAASFCREPIHIQAGARCLLFNQRTPSGSAPLFP